MENKNLSKEEVLEIVKGFKLQPTRGKVITTINTEIYDEGELQDSMETLSEYQYIVAVPSNSTLKPGDKVLIDIMKMSIPVTSPTNAYDQSSQIQLDPLKIGDNIFTFLNEGFIKAVEVNE